MHNAGSPHQDISQTCSRINYSTRQVAWEWLSKLPKYGVEVHNSGMHITGRKETMIISC